MNLRAGAALGIDGGGSSSRWLLLDASGRELGRGRGGPLTGHVLHPTERAAALERLGELLGEVRALAQPAAAVCGLAGVQSGSEAAALLQREVARGLGLAPERVQLGSDLHIAYASAFAPGAGVLVYAGTGSVAYHETETGEALRAGGYGYLIDDRGSGFWIGREGLRQVLRWQDRAGQAGARALERALYQALGGENWPDIFREVYGGEVYGGGRSRVAALAPAVAEAAGAGDEAAARILNQAGLELAALAEALLGRLNPPLPVAFMGGVTRLGPLVAEAFRSALPPGTPLGVVTLEPVEAAAREAWRLARAL